MARDHLINRWGTLIYKGDVVRCVKARGGEETGKVVKLETRGNFASAYGPRITLDSGASYAADDVVSIVQRA